MFFDRDESGADNAGTRKTHDAMTVKKIYQDLGGEVNITKIMRLEKG